MKLAYCVERLAAPGTIILNLPASLTQVFADKLATFSWLTRHSVATPFTTCVTDRDARRCLQTPKAHFCEVCSHSFSSGQNLPQPDSGYWVLKPRDGAGTDRVSVVQDAAVRHTIGIPGVKGANTAADRCAEPDFPWILQHRVHGAACSFGIIGRQGGLERLPVAEQWIDCHANRLSYRGGRIPAAESIAAAIEDVASRLVMALPPFRGYLGVDLVVDTAKNAAHVIEINPRLCTSFVGYHALFNLSSRGSLLNGNTPFPQPLLTSVTFQVPPTNQVPPTSRGDLGVICLGI